MIKLAEFTPDKINDIVFHVRKSINEVHKQNYNEDGIRIQMPLYFIELLQRYNQHFVSGFEIQTDKTPRCFGVEVLPSFDNFIVVYHVDMPLYKNSAYQVIDLK